MSKHKLGVKTSGDHIKVTPSCGNVFTDLGFTAEDYAAKLTEIERLREKVATLQSIIDKQLYGGQSQCLTRLGRK